MKKAVVVLCLVAVSSLPPSLAVAGEIDSSGVYLGLDYFTELTSSGFNDFLYVTPGIVFNEPGWFLDVRTSAIVAIPDAIIGAFMFLASSDSDIPLWSALNNGDDNPGSIRMLESEFRYSLWNHGGHKLDVGGLFDLWWMSPSVKGKHFGNIMWNLGPSAGWGYQSQHFSANASLSFGNGFSSSGVFNPFFSAEGFAQVRVVGPLGVYARFVLRHQSYDYSDFESNDINYPPEVFDIREWGTTLSIDGGLILLLM